jgi:hypothetical protein
VSGNKNDLQSGCAFKHLTFNDRWFFVREEQVYEINYESAEDLAKKLSSHGVIALVYLSESWPEKDAKLRERLAKYWPKRRRSRSSSEEEIEIPL